MVIRAGVVGHPIAHSLSPALHGRWLREFGIAGTYEAVESAPDAFEDTIARLRTEGWAGVNVTLPFKAEALALADEADPVASRTGSANTLLFGADGIHARNTDAPGFEAALRSRGGKVPRTALVLGAGGTAPAVLCALSVMGVRTLRISNRTESKAIDLAERFGAEIVPWTDRHPDAETDLLVNATALGLPGHPALEVDLSALPDAAVVADCVYARGGMTPLVAAARARGLTAFDGLPMLVHQAIPGFTAWYGRTPDDADAAEAALRTLA